MTKAQLIAELAVIERTLDRLIAASDRSAQEYAGGAGGDDPVMHNYFLGKWDAYTTIRHDVHDLVAEATTGEGESRWHARPWTRQQ